MEYLSHVLRATWETVFPRLGFNFFRFCQSSIGFIISNYRRATVVMSKNDVHVLSKTWKWSNKSYVRLFHQRCHLRLRSWCFSSLLGSICTLTCYPQSFLSLAPTLKFSGEEQPEFLYAAGWFLFPCNKRWRHMSSVSHWQKSIFDYSKKNMQDIIQDDKSRPSGMLW